MDKRCVRCLVPLDLVQHADDDMCLACKNYRETPVDWGRLATEFHDIIMKPAVRAPKYDCIVPLTGGKDSVFVAYYLARIVKARVLAFTWDNGLFSPIAAANMKRCTEALKIDHEMFRFHDADMRRRMLAALFKQSGSICRCPWFLMLSVVPRAIQLEVPYIILGLSEGQRGGDHTFKPPMDEVNRKNFVQFYKDMNDELMEALENYEPEYAHEIEKQVFGPWEEPVKDAEKTKWPKALPLSNYVDWQSQMSETRKLLAKEVDFETAPTGSDTHSSCRIEPVRGHWESIRGGTAMSGEVYEYVRKGFYSKEKALLELQTMGHSQNEPPEAADLIEFLGITPEEFSAFSKGYRTVRWWQKESPPGTGRAAYEARIAKERRWIRGVDHLPATPALKPDSFTRTRS